jgi:hypothetical protein
VTNVFNVVFWFVKMVGKGDMTYCVGGKGNKLSMILQTGSGAEKRTAAAIDAAVV